MDQTKKDYLSAVSGSMPQGGYSLAQLETIAKNLGIGAYSPSNTQSGSTPTPYQTDLQRAQQWYDTTKDTSTGLYPNGTTKPGSVESNLKSIAETGSPVDSAERRRILEEEQRDVQRRIDAINVARDEEVRRLREKTQGQLGTAGAFNVRAGLAGTPFASGQVAEIEGKAMNEENAIKAKYLDARIAMEQAARTASEERMAAKAKAMTEGAEAYQKYLKSEKEMKQKQLMAALQLASQKGGDITTFDIVKEGTKFGLNEADATEALVGVLTEMERQKLEKAPESVKEYEYATKYGGYTGSYTQYQNEDANRKAAVARAGAQLLGAGGLNPSQASQFSSMVHNYAKSPLIAAKDRTVILQDAIKQAKANPTSGPAQLSLIYGYVQALDTYQSAVREGELDLVNSIDSKIGKFQNYVEQVNNGQIVRADVIKGIADTAQNIINAIEKGAQRKAKMYNAQANVIGLGPQWHDFMTQADMFARSGVQEAPMTGALRSPDGTMEVDIASLSPEELAEARAAGWK